MPIRYLPHTRFAFANRKRGDTPYPGDAPNPDDLVYHLDGTISGSELVDIKNGYNFTINDKDFESDTYGGVPFKSGATISAPSSGAGKTAILAIDVNNYWYSVGETPNNIPICAFFQNTDFGNQLFSRETTRVVDGDSVETTPPLVTDICGYTVAQTLDSEFTDYFGADIVRPTAATDLFVSKDGNDTTGDGSWAAPYLTIMKSHLAQSTGDTIYVLGGAYEEVQNSLGLNFTLDKVGTWVGIGFIDLTSIGTTYVITAEKGNKTVSHFYVNAEENTDYNLTMGNDAGTFTFDKCTFTGADTGIISNDLVTQAITLSDCYCFTTTELLFKHNYTIVGCYVKNSFLINYGDNASLTYSKIYCLDSECYNFFNADLSAFTATIDFNLFYHGKKGITKGSALIGALSIQRNTFYDIEGGNIDNWSIRLTGATGTANGLLIKYNQFFNTGFNDVGFIQIDGDDFAGFEVEYNYMYNPFDGATNFASMRFGAVGTMGACKCNYNRIWSRDGKGYGITFGETGGDQYNGTEIIGNLFVGKYHWDAYEAGDTTHGILAGHGKFDMKYNWVEKTFLAYVLKSNANSYIAQAPGFYYNVGYNNKQHLYLRDCYDLVLNGNTFVSDADMDAVQVIISDTQYAGGTNQKLVFENNIIQIDHFTNSAQIVMNFRSTGLVGTDPVVFNNNIFDIPAGNVNFLFDDSTNYTYATSVTNGWVTTGFLQSVTFNLANVRDFTLATGSNGIADGETLAATYDDGLDETTDFNNDPTDTDVDNFPVIVTKQQTGTWDKGAYIS